VGHFSIKTEYDGGLDVTFVYPVGHLESEADCIAMCDGWVHVLAAQAPTAYFIAVMDMFSVAPEALSLYLEYVGRLSQYRRGTCIVVNFSAADSRAVADNIDMLNGAVYFASSIEDGVAILERVRNARTKRYG
jgi:hypothetical protein